MFMNCESDMSTRETLSDPRCAISPHTKPAGVISRVYKSGDTCMVDWPSALSGELFHDNVEVKVTPTTIAGNHG